MNSFCTAGKKALLDSIVGHVWKAALYTSIAKLGPRTKAYSEIGELPNDGGYTTGGITLKGARTGTVGGATGPGTAYLTFDDATWPDASFEGARFLLIYDATDENRAYAVIDFGEDKNGQNGAFIYKMASAQIQI